MYDIQDMYDIQGIKKLINQFSKDIICYCMGIVSWNVYIEK